MTGRLRRASIYLAAAAMILPAAGGSLDAAQAIASALRNQLAEASSPYLRAAAKQAVHWQEWRTQYLEYPGPPW